VLRVTFHEGGQREREREKGEREKQLPESYISWKIPKNVP
jgi:hypothetical protein